MLSFIITFISIHYLDMRRHIMNMLHVIFISYVPYLIHNIMHHYNYYIKIRITFVHIELYSHVYINLLA